MPSEGHFLSSRKRTRVVGKLIFHCSCSSVFRECSQSCIKRLFVTFIRPSFRPSVRPHGTTRLPVGGFSWKLIFDYFSKICQENSSFIKTCQFYMRTYWHLWEYFVEFFLDWEIFHTDLVDKTKTHILCSVTFFSENRVVCETIGRDIVEPDRPQTKIQHGTSVCVLDNQGYKYTLTICSIFCFSTAKKWLHESSSILGHTYIACNVSCTCNYWLV